MSREYTERARFVLRNYDEHRARRDRQRRRHPGLIDELRACVETDRAIERAKKGNR